MIRLGRDRLAAGLSGLKEETLMHRTDIPSWSKGNTDKESHSRAVCGEYAFIGKTCRLQCRLPLKHYSEENRYAVDHR